MIERNAQGLAPEEPSERPSWGPVEEAMLSVNRGVEVPTPTRVPSKMNCEPEVIEVPLKYATPFVVWDVAFVPPRLIASVPVVSPSATPSEEVAMAVGTADAPVPFTQREFAAMAAKLIEEADPPTWAPSVPELVRPVPTASEEVAT